MILKERFPKNPGEISSIFGLSSKMNRLYDTWRKIINAFGMTLLDDSSSTDVCQLGMVGNFLILNCKILSHGAYRA